MALIMMTIKEYKNLIGEVFPIKKLGRKKLIIMKNEINNL